MTALRVAGGNAESAQREKLKAELVGDAVAQLKEHIHSDPQTQEALFGRLMAKGMDEFASRTQAIKRGEFWRAGVAFLLAGIFIGWLGTRAVYQDSLTQGAVLGRGEALNSELRQTEDTR